MNSLLQALFMTPDFRQMIFKWRYANVKNHFSFHRYDPIINADKKDCILYQL